jgi:hypothetical protein
MPQVPGVVFRLLGMEMAAAYDFHGLAARIRALSVSQLRALIPSCSAGKAGIAAA